MQYEELIAGMFEYVKDNEPGCLIYRWRKSVEPVKYGAQIYVFTEKSVLPGHNAP